MINGERVRQARELRDLTQTELAKLVGLDQSAIANIEAGRFQPSESNIEAIALSTGFPPSFFSQEPGPDFPLGSLQFRAHASVTTRERVSAYRYAQVVYELVHRLMLRVKPIPVNVQKLSADRVSAAQMTRSALGLSPDRPIGNLIHVLEKAGVLVLALPMKLDRIDAFSAWVTGDTMRPVLVISGGKSGDRLRLSAAHDFGHLVLPPKGDQKRAEQEAFQFATEFLTPAEAMYHEMVPPVTLTSLAKLKAKWGLSIQALITRARDLNIITTRQYHYLFERLSAQGWRMQEPVFVSAEKPRAVRKMAELLYGIPVDYKRLAVDSHLAQQFAKEFIEAHAAGTELPPRPQNNADKRVIPIEASTRRLRRSGFPPSGQSRLPRNLSPFLSR